jgi:hypothetical protein
MSDLDDMRAAHRAAVEGEVRALEAHQRGWHPTVHSSLVNASSLVREAADHWGRSHEEGATPTQVRNRRDQAASMIADAIRALAIASYLLTAETMRDLMDNMGKPIGEEAGR